MTAKLDWFYVHLSRHLHVQCIPAQDVLLMIYFFFHVQKFFFQIYLFFFPLNSKCINFETAFSPTEYIAKFLHII